jgi:hypothetical protein
MKALQYRDYHNKVLSQQIATEKLRWVVSFVDQRTVDYRFAAHYHPYCDALIEKLNSDGLPALLDPVYQSGLAKPLAPALYQPGPTVLGDFPREEIDVSDDGPYSIYNWELFFHAPLLVAVHLSTNQRFEDAQRWFHRIFDPTSTDKTIDPPQRFWRFLRFRQETTPSSSPTFCRNWPRPGLGDQAAHGEEHPGLARQAVPAARHSPRAVPGVPAQRADEVPRQPHRLGRQPVPAGHRRNDQRGDTDLRSRRQPARAQTAEGAPRRKSVPRSYAQLKAAGIDKFGNALVELENEFPFNSSASGGGDASSSGAEAAFGIGRSLYFCIPQNDKLLAYWDKVADRLFKIRHCQNIEGVFRQLPLFDPPIDPGALVRAAAAGLDIASIVNNINQPLSTIRGPMLLQKALDLCSEVKALGSSLLSALEKGDAEHIALLRQQHELSTLNLARDVKFLQWKEAEAATQSVLRSRATVWERFRHYKRILGASDADIDAVKTVDLQRSTLTEENFDSVFGDLVDRYTKPLDGKPTARRPPSVV